MARYGTPPEPEPAPRETMPEKAEPVLSGHPTIPGGGRQYHLDALRSILMILGVFLHGSDLYASGVSWLVKDEPGTRAMFWLNQSIHFFRIPCFFILSGFFVKMLLDRMGSRPFVSLRMKRLALPLLSTALVFNSAQQYLLHGFRTGAWNPSAFLSTGAYTAFWTSGEWVGHLWFLVYALLFSISAALFLWGARRLRPACRGLPGTPALMATAHRLRRFPARHGLFLFLLPLPDVLFFAAAGCLPFLYWKWGNLSLYGMLAYSPYFAFGLIVFLSPRIREEFHSVRLWQAVAVPVALGLEHFLGTRYAQVDWARAALRYLDSYLVWSCCIALFAVFRFLFNRRSRLFVYLSEASYSIYLFHHVCVVGLGILLMGIPWEPWAKFAVVVGVSLAFSTALHHFLVMRVRVLRLLFMGK